MSLLEYDIIDHKLVLTLNDPVTRNAFSWEMACELQEILTKQIFQGILLKSSGENFCAGGNLRFYKSLKTKEEGLEINKEITKILDSLEQLKVPKICYVDGLCVGGGVELVSCFDFIVASPNSLFGMWQRRVGLSYGWGGEKRLLRKLKEDRLRCWLTSASTLTAIDARQLGLVDRICLNYRGIDDCHEWLDRSFLWGEESLQKTLDRQSSEQKKFESLWHSEKHRSILKKF